MSGLWARLRGESRGRHEQLSSHDEDNEMEAAFAGPEDQEQAEPLGRRAPSVPGPTASDQPYDTPLADHPLSSDCHTLSSARSSDDLSSLGAPAYDFELNPSELRSAPSSASNAESNNFMTGRVVPQGRSGQVRQALQWGLASLGHFSRYGRIRSQDPDGQSAVSVRGANDGVFANLSAKPEATSRTSNGNVDWVGGDDEGNNKEVPPSYDAAALDTTPPYWETTIIAPTGFMGPDEILVEGLPIGNIFAFAWNMLVSMSFQFVGFLLTYLLHTSHAAKHGSRAGLGITLIQYSLYLRSRAQTLQNELDKGQIPPELVGAFPLHNDNSSDTDIMRIHLPGDQGGLFGGHALGEDATATTSGATSTGEPAPTMLSGLPELQREGLEEAMEMSSMANDWLSYMLMFIGWALLVGAFLSYYKAWRWSKRMRCEQDDATNAAVGANATPAQQASIPLFDAEAAVRTDQEIQNNLRRAGLM